MIGVLAAVQALAMTGESHYMALMPSDPDLKRLQWRAHHRGTKEADLMIGGFFDQHHAAWTNNDRVMFEAILEQQDADIMAWALGTAEPPEHFAGRMIEDLRKLDYIRIAR